MLRRRKKERKSIVSTETAYQLEKVSPLTKNETAGAILRERKERERGKKGGERGKKERGKKERASEGERNREILIQFLWLAFPPLSSETARDER